MKYFKYIALNKIFLRLSLPIYFHFCYVATTKFKPIYVAYIIFLLNSTASIPFMYLDMRSLTCMHAHKHRHTQETVMSSCTGGIKYDNKPQMGKKHAYLAK